MENLPTLRHYGFFNALMMTPETLETTCLDYFAESRVPTFIGLCAALGTTPQKIIDLFKDNDPPNKESMAILASTLTHMEAELVRGGLTEAFNPAMSKFVLSAYHNRNDKHLVQTQTDSVHRIIVESRSPTTLAEMKEYNRLEDAINEQARNERIALGKESPENKGEMITVEQETEVQMMERLREEEFTI